MGRVSLVRLELRRYGLRFARSMGRTGNAVNYVDDFEQWVRRRFGRKAGVDEVDLAKDAAGQ
ncbi:hypothetical protein FAZ69_19460 [Trinickia terrae]|uniref:Integrase n=1 Tax=Trinickia terrae TaxID=2571161 RepID=A0A4U1I0Z8_9BURK|nr:hypothetical protein [Trinickia terrae]TKC86823.1 hypothetical protein FAZ69_19460 [Trinickia terrae]